MMYAEKHKSVDTSNEVQIPEEVEVVGDVQPFSHQTKVKDKNLAVFDVFYNKPKVTDQKDDVINIDIDISTLKKLSMDVDLKKPKELQKVAQEVINSV